MAVSSRITNIVCVLIVPLLSTAVSAQSDAANHESTLQPTDARFEVVQSPLAARWTFRLDRYTGRVDQMVTSFFGDPIWQEMPVLVSCHASYDASARPTGSVARRVPAGNGRLHCQGAQRGHGPRGARPSGDRHARHCRVVALANMPDIPCGPRLALTRMANSEAPELA